MQVSYQPTAVKVEKAAISGWSYVKFASVTLAATLASLAMSTQVSAQAMSKVDFNAAKTRISSEYKADKAICQQLAANAKDICIEEAKAKEKVAQAMLSFDYTAKSSDQVKISSVKADSAYAVAKEKCDDLAGIPKTTCRTNAKATHTKTLADIKMGKEINEAKVDDAKTKLDADYKVATQNCATLAEETKASCIAAAKMKFGK